MLLLSNKKIKPGNFSSYAFLPEILLWRTKNNTAHRKNTFRERVGAREVEWDSTLDWKG